MSPDKIRFECPQCGRPVRCSIESAGKRAKCPNAECGAELIVPTPPDGEPATSTPQAPTPADSFDLAPGPPPAFEQTPNPYQSPVGPVETVAHVQPGKTPGKVKAPGVALIIVGVLNALYAIMNGFSNLLLEPEAGEIPPEFQDNEFMREFWKGMNQPDPVVGVIFSVVMGFAALVIILGGVKMIGMKTYPLAVTASILSMLPCVTCLGCCGIGQAVGIWALVILLNEEVRSGFQ